MKLIIAGSRHIRPSMGMINDGIRQVLTLMKGPIKEIVSGCAEGVDIEGEHWASHYQVPVTRFRAHWELFGRRAGPMRNRKMAEYGDALLLIWDGESRGSSNMRKEALNQGLPVYEIIMRSVNESK